MYFVHIHGMYSTSYSVSNSDTDPIPLFDARRSKSGPKQRIPDLRLNIISYLVDGRLEAEGEG